MNEGVLAAIVGGFSVFGLIVAFVLAKWVLGRDTGTAAMREVSDAIKTGAEAFMKRQFGTILMLAGVLAVVLFAGYMVKPESVNDPLSGAALAMWVTISFVFGALCSVVAAYVGMWISIRANIRTAAGTLKSVNDGLQVALRAGAVSGFMVVVMSLLGVAGLFYAVKFTTNVPLERIPLLIVGYGFGASFVALFSQLGGGIYTKAADVGADLVGKVEAGIPEDDPRNPAVIADLVGDNVGDCAGRGADLFESSAAENIGSMILGASMAVAAEKIGLTFSLGVVGVMMFPLIARSFGILASAIGVFIVKVNGDEDPMNSLNRGFYVATALALVGFGIATRWLLHSDAAPNAWWHFFIAGIVGVVTALIYVYITQYYTEYKYRPVKEIADASLTGPATNIISGIAVGLESTAAPIIVISVALLAAYGLGHSALGGVEAELAHMGGLFGTAVATMGMLATAAYILAMDTFGPVADNAGGIVEMSGQPEDVREKSDRLDSVGNTTKALTKGYAVGSAALAAFLLFSAYMDEVSAYLFNAAGKFGSVDLADPKIFVGAMLGAMLVFLFCSLAIRAVGRAAQYVIEDVRDQFKADPGILAGTSKPDYGRTVDIVTRAALKEMIAPGLLVVLAPVVVGVLFRFLNADDPFGGAKVVAGMLMVGTITGILMALFFNNGGGSWDNAKKYVETGFGGGKGSETHKAAVVGDTVGDPFKDTAGPSLHVLIKLLSTITLVMAPLFINMPK
ncbi:MAG TPA: sodium-translocating pyrophosphatase [Coriobacteriia bacterium]|nr:sodium-translocating pyrophosphatase [Coriobacteriia bacterium]